MNNKYTRRKFLKILSFTIPAMAGAMALPGHIHSKNSSAPRPNIILIMSDDMGFSDIGCYGSEIKTPNLDKLASNGLRFTQFYNNGRCCPTRASLLTGLFPHQTGVGMMMRDKNLPGYKGDLNKNCVTIAEALKPAGYTTYMSGKWHVTKHKNTQDETEKYNWPRQRGFDRFYGTITGSGSFFDPSTLVRDNKYITPVNDPKYKPETFYYTDAISDNTVKFIKEHSKQKKKNPFFIYVAYTAAHWPMHALPEDIAKYKGKYDKGWDNLRKERHERMIRMGIVDSKWKLSKRDKGIPAWEDEPDKKWNTRCMEVYAAMIDNMDQGIGRIINELKKQSRLDNTLIFFLQDNGGCAEEQGRKKKQKQKDPDKVLRKPMGPDEIQHNSKPQYTRDGRPVRRGRGVMPGPADTYLGYGQPWANASDTPFRKYKHYIHEGGISTPLIAHWPAGIKTKNKFRNQVSHIIDIMPTCVEVAKAKYPSEYKGEKIKPAEGISLLPVFSNKTLGPRILCWEHHGNRGIRDGKWKLSAIGREGKWELYDIEADRSETNNLAREQPERVKKLDAKWQEWAKRTNVIPWPEKKKKRK